MNYRSCTPEEELELSRAVERDLRERIRELEDIIEQMVDAKDVFAVHGLALTAWQKILDRQEPPR